MDEMTGLGPLEPLLKDDSIADILINGYNQVYHRAPRQAADCPCALQGRMSTCCASSAIVAAVGRRVDESQPLVDARLLDGSRFNAAIRRSRVDGPLVSIRKFSKNRSAWTSWSSSAPFRRTVAEVLAAPCNAVQDDGHLGRHGFGQDDAAERAVGLHRRRTSG
jgi:pilus assembly protein CpaF